MKYLIPILISVALASCDRTPDVAKHTGKDTGAENITAEVTRTPEEAPALDTVKDSSGHVFEHGIYNALRKGRIRDEITANTGKVINKPVLEQAEQTDRIPLIKGTYFAYRYRILDLPKEVAIKPVVELRKIIIHPEITLPDGTTSTGTDRAFKARTSARKVVGFDGYVFNEDYELVEGDWTFQIWFRDKKLVEQTFTTYWPEEEAGGDQEPAAENTI